MRGTSAALPPRSQIDTIRQDMYKLYDTCFVILGLLPHRRTKITPMHQFICMSVLINGVTTQIMYYVRRTVSMAIFMSNLSHIVTALGFLVSYSFLLYRQDVMYEIQETVKHDWISVRNAVELEIMIKRAKRGNVMLRISGGYMYVVMTVVTLVPFWRPYVDAKFGLNKTGERELPFLMDAFIDEQKYYYSLLVVINVVLFIGCTTAIATEVCTTMWMEHICGLFEIVCNRVREAHGYTTPIRTSETTSKMIQIMKSSVCMQNDALQLFATVKNGYRAQCFILTSFGIVALGVDLFQIAKALSLRSYSEVIMSTIISSCQVSYTFYLIYVVQDGLNTYDEIFVQLYNVTWYKAPVCVQKMVLFAMTKCMQPFAFDMYNIFTANMEGFSSLLKMTISYFTVMHSTQAI